MVGATRAAAPRVAAGSPLVAAALGLIEHAAEHGWRGPDPYDGLWGHWPGVLTGGRVRRQVIVQAHARAPVDIRRLYRRSHPRLAKTLGLFASAGLRAHGLTGDPRALRVAVGAIDTLNEDRTAGPDAWGYPFDVQTRWSFYPAGAANVVVTSFAGRALFEAAEALKRDDLAERARAAARWALDRLWVEPEGFFAYHGDSRVNVHNANLLGAALVHRALPGDAGARERVARAVERTLAAQAQDGSWPYGEEGNLGWADSFHTGYVLGCLAIVRDVDPAIDPALRRGAAQYEAFFDARGRARLWATKRFPEDAHSAGTGLTTLAALATAGLTGHDTLERVARRVLAAGLHGRTAVARRYRWGRTTVWYPRWCDGHVALGLVDAAGALTAPRT